jgi:DNA-directed RNA polymerase subunit M/transcription elongation factor TFIIS
MSIAVQTCSTCSGTMHVPHDSAGESHRCYKCNGLGIAKRRGYGHYKNATTARAQVTRGNAHSCPDCSGTGAQTYPDTAHCHACTEGLVVTSALPGDAWPEGTPRGVRYAHVPDALAQAYADAVTVVVRAADREGTWNEAYLGLGSLTSVTDYGRQWDAMAAAARSGTLTEAVEAVRTLARTDLAKGYLQWVKLTLPDDTLATHIAITVHRSGYTISAIGATPPNVALPPTYTVDLLNAPVA